MKHLVVLVLIIIQFLQSCQTSSRSCQEKAMFIIENTQSSSLDSLIGFSATARGIDEDRMPFIIRINYTDHSRKSIEFPSTQKRRNSSHEFVPYGKDSLAYFKKTSIHAELDTTNARRSIYLYSSFIKEFFHKYEIFSMTSLLDLGDFIEFEIGKDCYLWYMPIGGEIRGNDELRKLFSKSLSLGNGWYVLRRPSTSSFLKEMEDSVSY